MTISATSDTRSSPAGEASHCLGAGQSQRWRWKQRCSPAGLHLFERSCGLNVLLDEVPIPPALWSRAPRHVSIALTNRCDSACLHCFAPKSSDELRLAVLMRWLLELDANGTLGVGFGGGEPTLHADFAKLCQLVASETQLSVTFTTHGHHINETIAEKLRGSVHFIRVSMDGVGATYEAIRRRPFLELQSRLKIIKTICRFGINVLVNERTLPDLDEVASVATDFGACELLLLPQMATRTCEEIDSQTLRSLRQWVDTYRGEAKLCINEGSAEGFPVCNPLEKEQGLRAYAHIDATGVLKPTSYDLSGVAIGSSGVLSALDDLLAESREKDT